MKLKSRKQKINILICVSIFLLGGCAVSPLDQRISLLKRLAANQKEIERDIKKQEKLFYKLIEDIKGQRLKEGESKEEILSRYGEPIFCKVPQEEDMEFCLYRHPTKYFLTTKVYFYFDQVGNLYSWELKEGEE
ncbi:MAG: hypothetical protein KKC42_04250 [Candidatus Omnitrophica bacterium]|nr:hypothetical protein [Candidatus Omnitrophota bacterium]